ncbi:MAG: hypothetical protein ACI88C_000037 [Acidimicrobiales bacterium]|jgi:hypothetical protein
MTNWGPIDFESGTPGSTAWITSGADSVYPFNVGSGGVEIETPYRTDVLTSGLRLLNGSATARALAATDNPQAVSAYGNITDTIYTNGSMQAISAALVHDIDAESITTARSTFRMRFDGQKSVSALWEDPSLYWNGGTPDVGSDEVEIWLDSNLHHLANAYDQTTPAAADYDGSPKLGTAYLHHSIVFPWRLRTTRLNAPALTFAGFWDGVASNWSPLCEARLFKFTDTGSITHYVIYLVWYPTVTATDAVAARPDVAVFSSAFIELATYHEATGTTPPTAQSPFFTIDSATGTPIWEEVEVDVAASLDGFCSMTVKRISDDYQETISVTGQAVESYGGLSPTGKPVGLQHFDVGVCYVPSQQPGSQFTNPATRCHLSLELDDVGGSDLIVGEGSSGATLLNEDFQFSLWHPYAMPLSMFPRGRHPVDDMAILGETSFMAYPSRLAALGSASSTGADIYERTNMWNFGAAPFHDSASGSAFNLNTLQLEAGGGPATYSPRLLSMRFGATWASTTGVISWDATGLNSIEGDCSGSADIRRSYRDFTVGSQTTETESMELYPYPNEFEPLGGAYNRKGGGHGFLSIGTSLENVTGKFTTYINWGATHWNVAMFPSDPQVTPGRHPYWSTLEYEGGPGYGATYNWWVRVPQIVVQSTSAGFRSRQFEVFLLGDEAVETDPGSPVGQGTPPKGVGLRFRWDTTAVKVVCDLFVETGGVGGADTTHVITGLASLDQKNFQDVVLACESDGFDLTIRCWVSGRRFYTHASTPLTDHTVPIADLSSLPYRTTGVQSVAKLPAGGFKRVTGQRYTPNVGSGGPGFYDGGFERRYDGSQVGYRLADLFDSNSLEHEHDFVAGIDPNHPTLTSWLNLPRVRIAWNTNTAINAPSAKRAPFGFYAYKQARMDDGVRGTAAEPIPGMAGEQLKITGDFPLAWDEFDVGIRPTNIGIYRGLSLHCDPDSWVDWGADTASVFWIHGQGGGTAAWQFTEAAHLPKGIHVLIWGNPCESHEGSSEERNRLRTIFAQIVAVADDGTITQTDGSTSFVVFAGGAANYFGGTNDALSLIQTHLRVSLTEEDDLTGTGRNFIATIRSQGDAFIEDWYAFHNGGVPLTLNVPNFTTAFSGTETGVFRWYGSELGNTPINDSWLTRLQIGTSTGVGSGTHNYKTIMGISPGASSNSCIDVRGEMQDTPEKRVLNVRGVVGSEETETGVLFEAPIKRRLLVFETDQDGNVPGSAGHSFGLQNYVKNWYIIGIEQGEGEFWGAPVLNLDDEQLSALKLHPLSVTLGADGSASMSLRQDDISAFGGHLRPGQFLVYVEQTNGAYYEIDAESGAMYGGEGVKVLFRGRVGSIDRSLAAATITYNCYGLQEELQYADVQDMTDCKIGQLAFNVEKGSPNTPYAKSTNLNYTAEHRPQFSPENFGDMLGLGIPDMTGFTVADIILSVLNTFKLQLNNRGLMRLTQQGWMTVANKDGSPVTFHADLGFNDTFVGNPIDDIILGVESFGAWSASTVVFAPNIDAFNIRPPETVCKGNIRGIMDGLVANLPDVRWRIDQGTLTWIFETRASLTPVMVLADEPGVQVSITDDAQGAFTAALFSSPWQKQESFKLSLRNGTLQPAWAQGLEGDWMQPFAQIGVFTGVIEEITNFPYQWLGNEGGVPQNTVMKIKVEVGEEAMGATIFNGVTFKILDGAFAGTTSTITNSNQSGGFTPPFQYFDIVVAPPLPGGFGDNVEVTALTLCQINDDPLEATTEETSAYSKVWADYILMEPGSGTPSNSYINGSFQSQIPTACNAQSGGFGGAGTSYNLPYNSVISDGGVAHSPVALTYGGGICNRGSADSPLNCGGEILYNARRIQEGTWCARAPEAGYAGTAFTDIRVFSGTIDKVHPDGKGFLDYQGDWNPREWEPQGGALSKIMLIGGHLVTFDSSQSTFQPDVSSTTHDDLNQNSSLAFDGGWEKQTDYVLGSTDGTSQSLAVLEERQPDGQSSVAHWPQTTAGSYWDTRPGIAFQVYPADLYGRQRGAVLTRFIPSKFLGPHTFDPILAGDSIADTSLNNLVEVEAALTFDNSDGLTSLAQVGLCLRCENGWVEQRRVPPVDISESPDPDTYHLAGPIIFDTTTIPADDFVGGPGVAGVVSLAHVSSEAYAQQVGAPQNIKAKVDFIPDWISSDATRKQPLATDAPTTGTTHDAEEMLGADGAVIKQVFSGNTPTDITASYHANSAAWQTAKRELKIGCEFGTTGYVVRLVRGDEPDCMVPGATASALYPTIFWYHYRRAVVPTGVHAGKQVLDTSGHPVFQGVKEIIFQSPQIVISAGMLNDGDEEVLLRASIENTIPNGTTNKIYVSVTGLNNDTGNPYGGQVSLQHTHDPRSFILADGSTETFTSSSFDGNYASNHEGFSMVRGGGGFGFGVCKAVMANANGNGTYTTVKPAKITVLRVRRINQPQYGVGGGELDDLVEAEFTDAVVGWVSQNDRHNLRFVQTYSTPGDTYVPRVGDHYRIYLERGWRIARQAFFETSGLDNPNKVWIYKHMADSALREAGQRNYAGTVTLPGMRYEFLTAGLAVSIGAASYYTGMQDAGQPVESITFGFPGSGTERQTIIALGTRSDAFTQIKELLSAEASSSVFQGPAWLGPNSTFNYGDQQNQVAAGNNTGQAGFGYPQAAQQFCGGNVYLGGGPNTPPLSLDQFKNTLDLWLLMIMVEVDDNKQDDPPSQLTGGGSGGGVISAPDRFAIGAGGGQGLTRSSGHMGSLGKTVNGAALVGPMQGLVLNHMDNIGRGDIRDGLVDPRLTWRDGGDGQLYSSQITSDPDDGFRLRWVAVKESSQPGVFEIDDTKLNFQPREACTTMNQTSIDGSSNSYPITTKHRSPVVQIVAQSGFASSGTAVAGDHLNSSNTPGFNIHEDPANPRLVTISATGTFGPCYVYLTT